MRISDWSSDVCSSDLVGYGLEGAIPDAATARITREYIAPKFRNNDYFGGIGDAVGALAQLIDGEPLPPPVRGSPDDGRSGLGLGQEIGRASCRERVCLVV